MVSKDKKKQDCNDSYLEMIAIFPQAIKRQNKEVVNLMLRVGVNISAPSCSSISALQMAVDRRNPHIEALVRNHMDRLAGHDKIQ